MKPKLIEALVRVAKNTYPDLPLNGLKSQDFVLVDPGKA